MMATAATEATDASYRDNNVGNNHIDPSRFRLRTRSGLRWFDPSVEVIPGEACFDRLQITVDVLVDYGSREMLDDYVSTLGSGEGHALLRTSEDQWGNLSKVKIREGWLIGGKGTIRFPRDEGSGRTVIQLRLALNPSRFLAHHSGDLDEIAGMDAGEALRCRENVSTDTKRQTLDRNDNVLLGLRRIGSSIFEHRRERQVRVLSIYLAHVQQLLEDELVPSSSNAFSSYGVFDDLRVSVDWPHATLQQAEVYFEFSTNDALSDIADIENAFSAAAQNVSVTEYKHATDRNLDALAVRVQITKNVRLRVYAKTMNRVRCEIAYSNLVRQALTSRPTIAVARTVLDLLPLVADDAARRLQMKFVTLARQYPADAITTAEAVDTLTLIAAAARHDPDVIHGMISLLLNTGGITEEGNVVPMATVRRLERENVLQLERTRHHGPARYVITPPHRAALKTCGLAIRSGPGIGRVN